jgi:hypothetical protein
MARYRPKPTIAAAAAVGMVSLGVFAAVELSSGGHAAASNRPPTVSTAKVVRTDLSSTQQAYGSITFADSYTVVNPPGTTSQALNQAQQAEATAQTALSAATTALAETDSVNSATISQAQSVVTKDQATLAADQSQHANATTIDKDSATLAADEAALSLAQAKATQAHGQAQAAVNSANQALANAQAQLATASQNAIIAGSTYTQLPAVGQQIRQGQTIYRINGQPVPLFYGAVAPWRDFTPGMSDGPDVSELETNLVQLGFGAGLFPSAHYGSAAVAAVQRWQASLGVAQTGQVRLGEMVFEPEALRVTSLHVTADSPVQPGQPVFDATGTRPVVNVALNVNQEYLVHQGDPVTVDLPDGKTTVGGHVSDIASVATVVQNSTQPGTPATNPSNNGPQATVNVTISLDHFALHGPVDQEPVTVDLTDQTAQNVLAVPVTALVALQGSGYGVKVVSGSSERIVAVQTGLFTNSMVQISGPGITEGTLVQVPSSS